MQLSNREKFLLYTELSKLVAAGFGIGKAAELLGGQAGSAPMRQYSKDLQTGLAQGLTVADAVARSASGVSALEVSILRATEAGGVLAEGFTYLRNHFEGQWKLWRTVRGRMLYPAFLLHLAAFVPVIPPLVTGQPLGDSLLRAGTTLGAVYLGMALLVFATGFLNRAAQTNIAVDRVLRRIPLFGGARRFITLQRFSGIFRVHLRCGAMVSVALDGAGEATQSAVFRQATGQLARAAERGEAIGGQMESMPIFPGDFARSLANAERIGGLEEDLRRWAEWYSEAVAARMDQIGVWVPKAFYLLVAVYVGWQVIRTYIGIYEPILEQLNRVM